MFFCVRIRMNIDIVKWILEVIMTKEIANNIKLISLNVEGLLFEGMWEMPKGVTLNSYVVKGKETAIIDGFCGWDGVPETLYKMLEELDVELDSIRYLIVNHMEPDHSGWIDSFQKIHSNFEIYSTPEAAKLLRSLYDFKGTIHEVGDGDRLDLGEGKVLSFHKTPNIHWPDTMMTFEESTGTLFACDGFGAFGMLDKNLASEYSKEEFMDYEREQLRYYAAILNTFSSFVSKGVEKVAQLPLKMICPGHGLVYDTPEMCQKVIDDYRKYVAYQKGDAEKKAVILMGTMYGNTEKMAVKAKEYLEEKGVPTTILRAPETDLGTLLMHTLEAKALVVASPTYEYAMFPPVASSLDEMRRKQIANRKSIYFGSYGWSGGAKKEYLEIIEKRGMKYESFGELEYNGAPLGDCWNKIQGLLDNLIAAL